MRFSTLETSISIHPRSAPCGTLSAFQVLVTVWARLRRGYTTGQYFVQIWDEDGFFGYFDDLLINDNMPHPVSGSGLTIRNHHYTLDCDGCIVRGKDGSSGEREAEVYAYVVEHTSHGFSRMAAKSNVIPVRCVHHSRVSGTVGDRISCANDTIIIPDFPGFERGKEEDLDIRIPVGELDCQIFPPGFDDRVSTISISPGSRFAGTASIIWRPGKKVLRRLTDGNGALLNYEPSTGEWKEIADVRVGTDEIEFQTRQGGIWGIAAREDFVFPRGTATTFTIPPQLPVEDREEKARHKK